MRSSFAFRKGAGTATPANFSVAHVTNTSGNASAPRLLSSHSPLSNNKIQCPRSFYTSAAHYLGFFSAQLRTLKYRKIRIRSYAASSTTSQHQQPRQISASGPGHSGAGCRFAGLASLRAPRIECKSYSRSYARCYCCICCCYCVVVEFTVCAMGVVAVQGMCTVVALGEDGLELRSSVWLMTGFLELAKSA